MADERGPGDESEGGGPSEPVVPPDGGGGEPAEGGAGEPAEQSRGPETGSTEWFLSQLRGGRNPSPTPIEPFVLIPPTLSSSGSNGSNGSSDDGTAPPTGATPADDLAPSEDALPHGGVASVSPSSAGSIPVEPAQADAASATPGARSEPPAARSDAFDLFAWAESDDDNEENDADGDPFSDLGGLPSASRPSSFNWGLTPGVGADPLVAQTGPVAPVPPRPDAAGTPTAPDMSEPSGPAAPVASTEIPGMPYGAPAPGAARSPTPEVPDATEPPTLSPLAFSSPDAQLSPTYDDALDETIPRASPRFPQAQPPIEPAAGGLAAQTSAPQPASHPTDLHPSDSHDADAQDSGAGDAHAQDSDARGSAHDADAHNPGADKSVADTTDAVGAGAHGTDSQDDRVLDDAEGHGWAALLGFGSAQSSTPDTGPQPPIEATAGPAADLPWYETPEFMPTTPIERPTAPAATPGSSTEATLPAATPPPARFGEEQFGEASPPTPGPADAGYDEDAARAAALSNPTELINTADLPTPPVQHPTRRMRRAEAAAGGAAAAAAGADAGADAAAASTAGATGPVSEAAPSASAGATAFGVGAAANDAAPAAPTADDAFTALFGPPADAATQALPSDQTVSHQSASQQSPSQPFAPHQFAPQQSAAQQSAPQQSAWQDPVTQQPVSHPPVPQEGSPMHGSGGPTGTPRWLIWTAIGLAAVLVLLGLFILGTRLPALTSAPKPTPTATPSLTPTPTPTPSATPKPAAAVGPGVHKWNTLGGGECLQPYTSPWAQTFTVVDCTAPHTAQMVYTNLFSADMTAPYPGASALASQMNLLCSRSGIINMSAAAGYPDLQIQGTYPATAEQWAAGERSYYCFASRSAGEPLTSSIAGAGPAS